MQDALLRKRQAATNVSRACIPWNMQGPEIMAGRSCSNWTNYVAHRAYGLGRDDPDQIVGCAGKAMCSGSR